MKFPLSLLLFSALVLAACDSVDEPPPTKHRPANYPNTTTTTTQQTTTQPFNPNGPANPESANPDAAAASGAQAPPAPQPAGTAKVSKGDFPYGIPVPGKPHLVESPFSPGKFVDVEGFAPGTEVKDPYTGKIFLVP